MAPITRKYTDVYERDITVQIIVGRDQVLATPNEGKPRALLEEKAMADRSIVTYIGATGAHRCGYCKSSHGFVSRGMYAYRLTCQNYQDLTDRGWRRSGEYCYLPTNDKMCCPLYIIRCEADRFVLSKSQKKVLKTMKKFLLTGDKRGQSGVGVEDDCTSGESASATSKTPPAAPQTKTKKVVRPGVGADPAKPPCRKAKDIRRERKLHKQAEKMSALSSTESSETTTAPDKSSMKTPVDEESRKPLESFLELLSSDKPPAHRLEVKLVQSSPQSPEFKATFRESYQLYKKYQMAVHHDPPDDCDEEQFVRFLVDSPLIPMPGPKEWGCGYGSYHNHYYIDGKLVMVGVVDILPNYVSSVYVYYDPDYNFLSPGVYSALYEIGLVRRLHAIRPDLAFYCMGFYVHSCQKMRYKGSYSPSFLLCSESHRFVPIEICRPKLDLHKYSRFSDEPSTDEDVDSFLPSILVLFQRQAMPYAVFCQVFGRSKDKSVREYGKVVGKNVATSGLLLFTR